MNATSLHQRSMIKYSKQNGHQDQNETDLDDISLANSLTNSSSSPLISANLINNLGHNHHSINNNLLSPTNNLNVSTLTAVSTSQSTSLTNSFISSTSGLDNHQYKSPFNFNSPLNSSLGNSINNSTTTNGCSTTTNNSFLFNNTATYNRHHHHLNGFNPRYSPTTNSHAFQNSTLNNFNHFNPYSYNNLLNTNVQMLQYFTNTTNSIDEKTSKVKMSN